MPQINSNDYYYYLHKTTITDSEKIESFFNEGLKSGYTYSIHSTMARIDEQSLQTYGLEECIKNYVGNTDEYNSAVIIKIPKRYMSDITHRDGKNDPAIPMFREYHEDGYKWNALFTPKLIQGVYCRDINKAFTNPNFNPVFEPVGCQYSDEQIVAFGSVNNLGMMEYAKNRRKYGFQQLYMSDKQNNTWQSLIAYYSQLYGVKPTQMTRYEMSDEDKQLFGGKRL